MAGDGGVGWVGGVEMRPRRDIEAEGVSRT